MSLEILRQVARDNEQALAGEDLDEGEPTREGVPLELWRALPDATP